MTRGIGEKGGQGLRRAAPGRGESRMGMVQLARRSALMVMPLQRPAGLCAAGLALGLALCACDDTRSFEHVAGGPVVYFDQVSELDKAEARTKVARALSRGLDR